MNNEVKPAAPAHNHANGYCVWPDGRYSVEDECRKPAAPETPSAALPERLVLKHGNAAATRHVYIMASEPGKADLVADCSVPNAERFAAELVRRYNAFAESTNLSVVLPCGCSVSCACGKLRWTECTVPARLADLERHRASLVEACKIALACPALNMDDLEEVDKAAIRFLKYAVVQAEAKV